MSTPVFNDKKCIKSLVAYNDTQEENEFIGENGGVNKEHEEMLQEDTNDQDGNNQYDSEDNPNEQDIEEDENDNSGLPIHQDLMSEDEEEHVNNQVCFGVDFYFNMLVYHFLF